MLISNRTRAGFSLTEVIVALFIMALGIISLLTLFPLGAVQMGRALRDDRSQTTAVIADAKMRMLWLGQLDGTYAPQAFYYTLDTGPAAALLPSRAGLSGPSYPLLFDPVGFTSYVTPKRDQIAGASGIARHTSLAPYSLTTTDIAANYASMPDDLSFKPDATPEPGDTTGLLVRQGRFNFAVMLQRPNNAIPTMTNMKVLVFDRRVPGIAANNETQYTMAGVTVGDTQLTFNTINMGLRTGSWIMDGTINAASGIRNANFYRVLSVEEVGGTTTVIDLESPIVKPSGEFNGPSYVPSFYVFQELIDVFDRPAIVPSTYNQSQP